MNHTVVLLERLPQDLLAVRTLVRREEIGRAVDRAVAEIRAYLVSCERSAVGPPCARFRPGGVGELEVDVGVPVPRGTLGDGHIRLRPLASGLVAVTQHYGPLSRLREAYDAVAGWIARERVESRGAPWEVYWSEPSVESDPLHWRTELLWPVQRVRHADVITELRPAGTVVPLPS